MLLPAAVRPYAADVDGTSGITAADALLILKRATGAIDTFPGARA